MALNAENFNNAFETDIKISNSHRVSVCEQMKSQHSQKKMVDSKACVVGKEDGKYVCETHGKRFTSRQYMSVHLTNCGMEPLPKLKRGRKSLGAKNFSLKDLPVEAAQNQSDEKNPQLENKKRSHNRVKMYDGGQEAFSTSNRGKKIPSTMSVSRGTTEQKCVVEQYDDVYVCEAHGLKYGSRHTINVHLMNCGMEPLPKLKRGRKSSSIPLESKRRRYEPSRSQETVLATSAEMKEKSSSKSSPGATNCILPPERLDRDNGPTPSFCLLIPKLDDPEVVNHSIEEASRHLKLQVV